METVKTLFWNNYSKTIGLTLVGLTVLAGVASKSKAGKISGNALYAGMFGLVVGAGVYSWKKTNQSQTTV